MLKKVPHTYVIIFAIILLAALMTWIFPGGTYVPVENADGGTEMVFQSADHHPQSWQVFTALFKGFEKQSGIIAFILMIGGAFWILNHGKAIDVGILAFLRFTRKLEHFSLMRKMGVNNLILILIMLMFSIFGAVFGMSEETIAFIIILVPLAISMGYDSITGVNMVFTAAALGFAGAILNPFTIGIAQGLSGLPLFSGIEYRLFMWVVINLVGITWMVRYAAKIHNNPHLSVVYEDDQFWRERDASKDEATEYYTPISAWISYAILGMGMIAFSWYYPDSSLKIGNSTIHAPMVPINTAIFLLAGFWALRKSVHFYVLILLAETILYLITGVMGYEWYIMEIASLFFAMGIFAGIAYGYNANQITKLFIEGVKDILSAGLVVGLAGGIIIILKEGNVIDSMLHAMAGSMEGLGKTATVSVMYVIQTLINIVIPSGSAKAALTIPIMAPFSDLVGLSRQATVVAFQLGDGFTNIITPTSGVLIGVLGVARIPYDKWVKWVTPFLLVLIILGFLLLIPTVHLTLNGF